MRHDGSARMCADLPHQGDVDEQRRGCCIIGPPFACNAFANRMRRMEAGTVSVRVSLVAAMLIVSPCVLRADTFGSGGPYV